MTKKYKILGKFIKDMSSETKDVETYIFVKDQISKYKLDIDINSQALKDKMILVNTILRFHDKEENKKKAFFEIIFSTIVQISEEVKEKKEIEKIVLSDVQTEISKDLEKALLNLIDNSGYPGFKLEKKLDFEDLYNKRLN
tara:strand:+ start:178 stop:600 length:423 start_codon:yes stop_codon:yes gene_type:complete